MKYLKNLKIILMTLMLFLLSQQSSFASGIKANGLIIEPYIQTGEDDRSWFAHKTHDLNIISDNILVSNYSNVDKTIFFSGVDGEIQEDQTILLKENSNKKQNVGKWLEIQTHTFTIPAQHVLKVPFIINVPKEIENGVYWGGLMVNEIQANKKAYAGFDVSYRLGLRTLVKVDNNLAKASKLSQNEISQILDQNNSNDFVKQVTKLIIIYLITLLMYNIFKRVKYSSLITVIALIAIMGLPNTSSASFSAKFNKTKQKLDITLNPSEVYEGNITLTNTGDNTTQLLVSPATGVALKSGSIYLNDKEVGENKVGGWIALEESKVTLLKNETKDLPFTITIPESPEVGDHLFGFLVTSKEQKNVSGGMIMNTEYAYHGKLNIPGEKIIDMEVSNFQYVSTEKTNQFTLDIENRGNVYMPVSTNVKIANLIGGEEVDEVNKTTDVPPSTTMTQKIDWESDTKGLFKATATVNYADKEETFTTSISTLDYGQMAMYGIGGFVVLFFVGKGIISSLPRRKEKGNA